MAKSHLYKRSRLFNSRQISAVSIILFIVVILIIFGSNRYMESCIGREIKAQQNRTELCNLGGELADASDYLTDEARKFAVTGDIEHLYNYWHEVYGTKTRDNVISELSAYDLPAQEKELLSKAKVYSDTLIETETLSMRLVLTANSISPMEHSYDEELYTYLNMVADCDIPAEYEGMSAEQMRLKSIEILYDSFYNESKNQIMSPIGEFQTAMNNRLENEVELTSQGIGIASDIQIYCSLIVLLLIGMLMLGLNKFYIRPLKAYSDALSAADIRENVAGMDFSRVRVTPSGAYELYQFGEIFNRLSVFLFNELKKRVKAEEEMRRARDEADKANNAKSEFFAQMSHELRTPLNAITGYLYLLKDTSLDERQKRYCSSIEVSSENLLGLINNVLDFSKIESGNLLFEKIDFSLPQLMKDVYSIMENGAAQKGLALRLETDENMPSYVKGDPLRLKQVLINLLSNSLKFTAEGELVLWVKCLSDNEDGCLMEFGVRDTGIGIESEDIDRIFEPFVQSDAGVTRRYGGTGLGLSIAQMIVEGASGGKYGIEVSSQIGRGSSFYFKMQLEYGEESAAAQSKETEYKKFEKSASILLVDDNEINLAIEKEILQKYSLTVITAKSGYEAIETAGKIKVDMVLLDLRMPEMDGYETAKRLRLINDYRYVPIVALTADVVTGVEEKIKSSDMNDYLSKPFKPDRLRDIIEKYLNISRQQPQLLLTESNTVFDYNECLEKLGGDKAMLYRLIESFISGCGRSCEFITIHIEQGYYMNACGILHDVLGLAGNLCCKRLYNAAAGLRAELTEKHCESISLDVFTSAWNETMESLKTYLAQNKINTCESEDNQPFKEKWLKFIDLCESFDIAAADYFDKNRSDFKKAFSHADYIKLEEHIKRYDFMWITENISYGEME